MDGVEGIAEDEGEAEYFTLQGVRVDEPEEGIYIVRKGGKSSKDNAGPQVGFNLKFHRRNFLSSSNQLQK